MEALSLHFFLFWKQKGTSVPLCMGLRPILLVRGEAQPFTVIQNHLSCAARQPLVLRILYAAHMLGLNNANGFELAF